MKSTLKKLGTAMLALALISSGTVAEAKPKKKGGKMVLIWPMLVLVGGGLLIATTSGANDRQTSP